MKAEEVRLEVEMLRAASIIWQSTSPWSSPVVPVIKPDKNIWLCVDYRRLNILTMPDPYCMPIID